MAADLDRHVRALAQRCGDRVDDRLAFRGDGGGAGGELDLALGEDGLDLRAADHVGAFGRSGLAFGHRLGVWGEGEDDAAVLGAAGGGGVVGDRVGLAVSVGGDAGERQIGGA